MVDNKELFYPSSQGSMETGSLQSGFNYFSVVPEDLKNNKDLENIPYRYIGLLQITNDYKTKVKQGSGFLISETHVLTAAHNLKIENENAITILENILFYPHVTLPLEPFNHQYDFAVLKLSQPIGKQKGYFGLMAPSDDYISHLVKIKKNELDNFDDIQKIQVAGYPVNNNYMKRASHHIIKYSNELIYYLIPTYNGQSGGPLFISLNQNDQTQWLAIGIHIYGSYREKFSNRITQQKYYQIQEWMKDKDVQIEIPEIRYIKQQQTQKDKIELNLKQEEILLNKGSNHQHGIRCLQIINQDKIITGEFKSSQHNEHIPKIKIWNLNERSQIDIIQNIGTCRKFVVDGYLLIYTDENKLKLYDWFDNKQLTFLLNQGNNQYSEVSEIIADDKIYSIIKMSFQVFIFGDQQGNVYYMKLNEYQEKQQNQIQEQQQVANLQFTCEFYKLNTEDNKHISYVYCLSCLGKYAFSSGKDKQIKVWSFSDQQILQFQLNSGHTESVLTMDVINQQNQAYLITGSKDKSVKLFEIIHPQNQGDVASIKLIKTLKDDFSQFIQSICFVNREEIAVADGNTLWILNINGNQGAPYQKAHNNQFFITNEPYSNKFFTGGDDNKLYVWQNKEKIDQKKQN